MTILTGNLKKKSEYERKHLSIVLSALRKKRGFMSVREFSDVMNVPESSYYRWERGGGNITLESIMSVCEIHQISVSQLFLLVERSKRNGGKILQSEISEIINQTNNQ